MQCPNCLTAITCGCQRRVASNGATVCSSCISAYERNLANLRANPPQVPTIKPISR